MSLKFRLSLLLSGLLLAAVGALSAVLIWSEGRALMEDARRGEIAAAAGLADVCRGAVVGQQDLLLSNYLKRLGADPDVTEALCADLEGRVLGHTDMAQLQNVVPALAGGAAAPSLNRSGASDEAVAPVALGERRVGTARVTFSRARMAARVEESLAQARRRILQASLWVTLACFAAAFAVTRWAIRPVTLLVDGVRTIAGGKLDHKIPLRRNDELGLLSREFNRMAERLSELDRLKQDFVSGITHDLKSPLTTVKAATEVLQGGKASPEDAAGNLRLIHDSADRLMNLITSILEVAHIESGLSLHRRDVRLEEVAERVVRALAPVARAKGLTLDLVLAADLPPLSVDESKIERAVANLVGNAVKFTRKGGVTVELAAREAAQELRVSDTGPGLPAELTGRLFTKFSRAHGDGAKVEGSGLGLAIAKGIVEAHGGGISVDSRPGEGTAFTVRLPA